MVYVALQVLLCPQEILFDNAKTIMIERDAYQEGQQKWNPKLLDCAKKYSFRPRVCKSYRAQTKGKVERFNGYLKSSFIVPLKASLKTSGLLLDVDVANAHIGWWLQQEQQRFTPLPQSDTGSGTIPVAAAQHVMPYESLPHPLSVYEQLLGVS